MFKVVGPVLFATVFVVHWDRFRYYFSDTQQALTYGIPLILFAISSLLQGITGALLYVGGINVNILLYFLFSLKRENFCNVFFSSYLVMTTEIPEADSSLAVHDRSGNRNWNDCPISFSHSGNAYCQRVFSSVKGRAGDCSF